MSGPNSHGRISTGISADAAARTILEFVQQNLAPWRDDPDRPAVETERALNSQLCKYLNSVARTSLPMVQFNHEEPQGRRHSVDISASPVDGEWIAGKGYSKYDPILLLEGKRLPTPGSGREREYVASPADARSMGGMQRFKLGLHGADVSTAAIIGYVQEKSCKHWFAEINRWIEALSVSSASDWSKADGLDEFRSDRKARVSRCESRHTRRQGQTPKLRLSHLWVEMSRAKVRR